MSIRIYLCRQPHRDSLSKQTDAFHVGGIPRPNKAWHVEFVNAYGRPLLKSYKQVAELALKVLSCGWLHGHINIR